MRVLLLSTVMALALTSGALALAGPNGTGLNGTGLNRTAQNLADAHILPQTTQDELGIDLYALRIIDVKIRR